MGSMSQKVLKTKQDRVKKAQAEGQSTATIAKYQGFVDDYVARFEPETGTSFKQIERQEEIAAGAKTDLEIQTGMTPEEFHAQAEEKKTEEKKPGGTYTPPTIYLSKSQPEGTTDEAAFRKEQETIRLGQEQQQLSPREQAYKEHPVLTQTLETTAIALGAVAAGLGIFGLATGAFSAAAASVGTPAVSKTAAALASKAGISVSTASKIAINPKTLGLTTNVLSKVFSSKTLSLVGGWAGLTFLGKWAQAESGEPLAIPLRDALKQAQETGDWSIYDEYKAAFDEITNLSTWEKIISWSPAGAITGISAKIKGVIEGGKLIDAIAQKAKETPTGETFEESSKRLAGERRETELKERAEDTEFFEKQRQQSRELELEERAEDEKHFARQRAEAADRKAAERKADEEYWAKIYEANEKRKEGEKPATIPEFEEIKKEKTKTPEKPEGEPLTPEEKVIISDWNAGKSALNFKWLGR